MVGVWLLGIRFMSLTSQRNREVAKQMVGLKHRINYFDREDHFREGRFGGGGVEWLRRGLCYCRVRRRLR